MAIINELQVILKRKFACKLMLRQAQQTGENRCSWIVINRLSVYTFVVN